MGIPGLTRFISKKFTKWCHTNLNKWDHLIIDGSDLCYALYEDNHPWCLGGEYEKFRSTVIEFFIKEVDSNHKHPIVVFHGGSDQMKEDIRRQRRLTTFQEMHNLQKFGDPVNPGSKRSQSSPLMLRSVFLDVLQSRGIEFYFSDSEADEEIVALANYYKCPVLASDSDFFMFKLDFGFINLEQYRSGKKSLYHIHDFQYQFNLNQYELCLIIPSVFGNDFIPHDKMKPPSIHDYASLLKQLARYKTCDEYLARYGSAGVRKKFKIAKSQYCDLPAAKISVTKEALPEWVKESYKRGCFPGQLLGVYQQKKYMMPKIVEVIESDSAWSISRHIRQYLYGFVGMSKDDKIMEVLRTNSSPELHDEAVFPKNLTPPVNIQDDLFIEEDRVKLTDLVLSVLLCDKVSHDFQQEFSTLSDKWKFPIASTFYWYHNLENPLAQRHLVKSLLLSFLTCSRVIRNKVLPLQPVNDATKPHHLLALHAFAKWQCVYFDARALNYLAREPFPTTSPAYLYSGEVAMYYAFYYPFISHDEKWVIDFISEGSGEWNLFNKFFYLVTGSDEEGMFAISRDISDDRENDGDVNVDDKAYDSDDETKFIKSIDDAIASSGKINRKLAHSVFIGPPGSGKSSFIDRLLGRLREGFSKSTGVCKPAVIVDIDEINPSALRIATVEDSTTWKEVNYEVSLVSQMGQKNIVNSKEADVIDDINVMQVEAAEYHHQSTLLREDNNYLPTMSSLTIREPVSVIAVLPENTLSSEPIVAVCIPTVSVISVIKKYGFPAFKSYLQKTSSLYLRDTGGQVEFQEMLPILIVGPSLFFFVFRADLDFQSKFSIEYRESDSKSINSYTSSITTEEALLQCLASVYAADMPGKEKIATHKPLVFIIATHIDKLGSLAGEKIAWLNEHIDSLIKRSVFQGLVQYADADNSRVIFAVDNTSDSDEAFQLVRSKVTSLISCRNEFAIEYPVNYLLVCLDLQNVKKNIISINEFKILAKRHGIEGDQVFHLLRFLHFRIGIIRYYDVEGLRNSVIIQPQVLFNTITALAVKTFSCEALKTEEIIEFKRKGILGTSAFESVISSEEMKKGIVPASAFKDVICSSGTISPKMFLHLLVHIRIIAPLPVTKDEEEKYFIPCVLNHVPESSEDNLNTDILPLAVKFKCQHSPKGVFGVLVTHLMTPDPDQRSESSTTFTLIQDKIFKDQVSFMVHSEGIQQDEISLRIYSSHLEIHFFPDLSEDRDVPIEVACQNVSLIIEKSLFRSLKHLNYIEDRIAPMMCLECDHCSELHEVIKGKKSYKVYCVKAQKSICLPEQGRCWYGEADPPVIQHVPSSVTRLCEKDFTRIWEKLHPYPCKWRSIGLFLGFIPAELSTIESTPTLFTSAPSSYLSAVLSSWLQWAPGDARGSRDYATLEALRTAVDKAGLGLTAQEL